MPPIHRALLHTLLGSSRDPLLPPWTTTVPISASPRPPPEPPPPKNDNNPEGSLIPKILCISVRFQRLLRPPPNPPWPYHRFLILLRSNLVYGASTASLTPLLCINHVRDRMAFTQFDKNPHMNYGFLSILASHSDWRGLCDLHLA